MSITPKMARTCLAKKVLSFSYFIASLAFSYCLCDGFSLNLVDKLVLCRKGSFKKKKKIIECLITWCNGQWAWPPASSDQVVEIQSSLFEIHIFDENGQVVCLVVTCC